MFEQGFGINIEDDSIVLPSLVIEQNTKAIELYDWQRRATEYFFKHPHSIFEVTTGAGKTFCAIYIMRELLKEHKDMRVLIVVPKNVILERTWFKELYDSGFNLQDIGVYYGAAKEYAKVTITNMQSINKVALDIFDMIIFDEIHNYASDRMLKYLKYPFKYKLGLSATLERIDDKHYDILKIFNYHCFEYTPKEALSDGVLNPFNFTNIGVTMDADNYAVYEEISTELNLVLKQGGSYNKLMKSNDPLKFKMLKLMNRRKQLVLNYPLKFEVTKEIAQKHKDDKVLIFNEYNEQTNKMYWELLDVGVGARIMHSGISHEKREKNLTDFKTDKFNVMVTSRVLDEGYNLPKIDTAIIMAGNSTAKQTIQRMGRVLRKKKNISNLYQVYIKDTMEERYADGRAKLFKELCHEFEDIDYIEGEKCL